MPLTLKRNLKLPGGFIGNGEPPPPPPCTRLPTRRTAPVNGQRCVVIFLPPRNGGRDRALLQNDRRKFLNSFPFFHPQRLCHQNSHDGRAKKSNTLKAEAAVLSRNKTRGRSYSQKMHLYFFFTMVQKSQKMTKNPNQSLFTPFCHPVQSSCR